MRRFFLITLGLGMFGLMLYAFLITVIPEMEPAQAVWGTTAPGELIFPFPIRDTELVAVSFALYDGPFLEDGSGEEVSGTLALVLRNEGDNMVESADVSIECDGGSLQFRFTNLPSKAAILVPELSRTRKKPTVIYACSAEVSCLAEPFPLAERLRIEETGPITLEIQNISKSISQELALYYKTYDFHSDMYIGGITYAATVPPIPPGRKEVLSPYRYVKHYARIVAAIPKP